jgi:hypothetical protein
MFFLVFLVVTTTYAAESGFYQQISCDCQGMQLPENVTVAFSPFFPFSFSLLS